MQELRGDLQQYPACSRGLIPLECRCDQTRRLGDGSRAVIVHGLPRRVGDTALRGFTLCTQGDDTLGRNPSADERFNNAGDLLAIVRQGQNDRVEILRGKLGEPANRMTEEPTSPQDIEDDAQGQIVLSQEKVNKLRPLATPVQSDPLFPTPDQGLQHGKEGLSNLTVLGQGVAHLDPRKSDPAVHPLRRQEIV